LGDDPGCYDWFQNPKNVIDVSKRYIEIAIYGPDLTCWERLG